jgi:hypothetical protein
MGGLVRAYAAGGLVAPLYAAAGMLVPFRAQGTDTVPAMLTPGEGVLTRAAMASIGGEAGLRAFNTGAFSAREEGVTRLGRSVGQSGSEGGGSPASLRTVTILQIDKREIGRAIADVLPGELRRLGVRVRT